MVCFNQYAVEWCHVDMLAGQRWCREVKGLQIEVHRLGDLATHVIW